MAVGVTVVGVDSALVLHNLPVSVVVAIAVAVIVLMIVGMAARPRMIMRVVVAVSFGRHCGGHGGIVCHRPHRRRPAPQNEIVPLAAQDRVGA